MELKIILPAVAGLVLLAACAPTPGQPSTPEAGDEQETPAATSIPRPEGSPTGAPGIVPLATFGPASPAVELALAQAAQVTGAPADAMTVVQVEAADWPDTSLGCPQPGMFYAQVITPGWLIVVQAADQTLEFHSDQSGRTVILCNSG